jgi:DNA-binding MarR family transcriptional regulator
MYAAHIMSAAPPTTGLLHDLDVAITAFRRFWTHPSVKEHFLSELGVPITPTRYLVVRVVAEAGNHHPSVGDVAAELNVDASTASRFVAEAVSAGYVERTTCTEDRRRSRLRVTPAGRELLDRGAQVRLRLLSELTADWDESEVVTLATLLGRLGEGARDMPGGAG